MSDEYTSFPVSFMLAIGEAREAGAKAERERIIALLHGTHIQENKAHHLEKPSGVCKTCRMQTMIEDNDATYIKGDDK